MNAPAPSLSDTVERIVGYLAHRDNPGFIARLRRDALADEPGLSFYRVAVDALPPGWERNSAAWRAFLAACSILTPALYSRQRRLGAALASASYSELRLTRLLSASRDLLPSIAVSVARLLKAKKEGFDFAELLNLLLAQQPDAREAIRAQIATAYARAQFTN